MHLARLATIELTRPAPPRLGRWTLQSTGGVTVRVSMIQGAEDVTEISGGPDAASGHNTQPGQLTVAWPYESSRSRLAVDAIVSAGGPELDESNLVVVPVEARRAAEAAIVEYADLLAVTYQCRRIVRSPKPCLAVIAENEAEQAVLDGCGGIAAPLIRRPRALLLPAMGPDWDLGSVVADRMDGVALLADALSEDGPIGQVHDMFRLFERAFATGPYGCIEMMLDFLCSGPIDLGWGREEMEDWFGRLRSEVTHADRREKYARATDVQPYLPRIEVAAYDVLLNKASWRTTESRRRPAVRLAAGVDVDGQTLRLQRPDVTAIAPWVDPFGVFPVDFNFHPSAPTPAVTLMPGYADAEANTYMARLQVRHDYAADDANYEIEVLTQHNIAPATPSERSARGKSATNMTMPDMIAETARRQRRANAPKPGDPPSSRSRKKGSRSRKKGN